MPRACAQSSLAAHGLLKLGCPQLERSRFHSSPLGSTRRGAWMMSGTAGAGKKGVAGCEESNLKEVGPHGLPKAWADKSKARAGLEPEHRLLRRDACPPPLLYRAGQGLERSAQQQQTPTATPSTADTASLSQPAAPALTGQVAVVCVD